MVEHSAPAVSSKKTRVEPVNNAASENRKLRNRLSQKAFRARQSLYIKDLEKKLEWASKPESDQNAKLEETNSVLRGQLLDCHKKLESFQVTLKALADSVAYSLGIEKTPVDIDPTTHNNDDSDDAEAEGPPAQDEGKNEELKQSEWSPDNEPSLSSNFYDFSEIPTTSVPSQSIQTTLRLSPKPQAPQSNIHGKSNIETGTLVTSILPRLPSNDLPHFSSREVYNPTHLTISSTYEQMMGTVQYNSYLGNESLIAQEQTLQINHTNSPFSDHITVFENVLRQKLSKSTALIRSNERCAPLLFEHDPVGNLVSTRTELIIGSVLNSAYIMLSTFICASWPAMATWHCATKAHVPITKVITYHVNPTAATYADLVTNGAWVPTKIQIYVVEADVSKLVMGAGAATGNIGVWDLVRSMSGGTKESAFASEDNISWDEICRASFELNKQMRGGNVLQDITMEPLAPLPAPNVAALFNSKQMALSTFVALGMNQGVAQYKLDPAFF
ncbi:bZIP transcription factor [Botrytis cinerea]